MFVFEEVKDRSVQCGQFSSQVDISVYLDPQNRPAAISVGKSNIFSNKTDNKNKIIVAIS